MSCMDSGGSGDVVGLFAYGAIVLCKLPSILNCIVGLKRHP